MQKKIYNYKMQNFWQFVYSLIQFLAISYCHRQNTQPHSTWSINTMQGTKVKQETTESIAKP